MDIVIRPAVQSDAAEAARIYNYYVANTYVTFETEAVPVQEMERRIAGTAAAHLPWLVAEASGGMIGYASASKWKSRFGYRFSVESSIYLASTRVGSGSGLKLYAALMDAIRELDMHSVAGGIALPNEPSVRLHERLGFRKVAHFEEVGYKQERWVDVGYWQLLL